MRRAGTLVVCLVLGTTGSIALGTAAVHAIRSTLTLAGPRQVALADRDDAYYSCLERQVQSLVPKDSPVVVSVQNLGDLATLGKAVAEWAQMVKSSSANAVAELSLVPRASGPACLGSAVEARFRDGRVVFGSGASMPGTGSPPATPL